MAMVGEVTPVSVDPAAAGRDFWARYHVFRRARQKASRPDDPLSPDAEEETLMKRVDPFEAHERFEVSRDGTMLGWLDGKTVTPRSPEYETNKHLYDADFYVLPEHRRQGVGTSFLPVIVDRMRACGATTVSLWADEEPGHEFARWAGAEPKMTNIESRLKLSAVDWSMLERWVEEGKARSPQTRMEIYDGPLPEAMWADYAPQLSSLLNTIPFEGLDHGTIVITPDQMREFYARLAVLGTVQHTVLTREPSGVISGITDTGWAPHHRTIVYQWFTGVRADARGRGLGKWIKAAMLLHLRERHREVEWISTDNAGSNAPMLKINRTMGFRTYREGAIYQITLAGLEKRLVTL
ncbi:MAG TPA: GNAT family N-acetyltransferase [Candidatus Dormibacteraeota bacterium]|nr:GNAT family N-acetyltransferase [Candidatus Dormibacteraeota bacterium]